ncbi:MAG: ABC transporter ATP-binding protein [Lachnospiraceae bacterium]|nr:ABC transporter ATP-binding protein [Lachnospiraceae bacterium]MBQ8232142.1 ABC transporter ATP-binding protein [Lachnospiraceae bacterium]
MKDLQSIDKNEIAIEVKDVKKKFRSYQDKATSFKERFVNPSRGKHQDVMVLKGISFQVARGEAVGIIGKNGCGKSTTLKLLTGILSPNEGSINMKGRVSSLIELGAGFHPDMTGRENIYTNASIFGITRKEVDKRLSDIIRFSELEEFIDNPVRTYSSGMYMRLAFAVAINVDADILLIDEILAVGDSSFQKKCFEKLKEIKANGTTIVIVSHSMDQMYKICDRLIWLENGHIKDEGIPRIIGEEYLHQMENGRIDRIEEENRQIKDELENKLANEEKAEDSEEVSVLKKRQKELEYNETLKDVCKYYQPGARRGGTGEAKYCSVILENEHGNETNIIHTGEKCRVRLGYKADHKLENIRFSLGITREDGIYAYGSCKEFREAIASQGEIILSFTNALLSGKYVLDLWLETFDGQALDSIHSLMLICVETESDDEKGFCTMGRNWTLVQKQEDCNE